MKKHLKVFILITFFGLLAYANSFQASFHFDDLPPIVENPVIQDLSNLPRILNESRGLVTATFALNYAAGGLYVLGYHLFNVSLHLLNAILVYFILFFTLNQQQQLESNVFAQRIAAFTAMIFIVHPIQTQAVTYIVQRYELMASTCYLLGLFLFIRLCAEQTRRKRIWFGMGVFAAYMAGLMSKEIAVTLPVALLLYDYCFVSKGRWRAIWQRGTLHGLLILTSVWYVAKTLIRVGGSAQVAALAEQGRSASAGFAVKSVSALDYFLTQGNVLLHYVSLILFPIQQNLDYDFPIARSLWQTPVTSEGAILNGPLLPPAVAWSVLFIVVMFALVLTRRTALIPRVFGYCLLMFFLVLAPTSSFVPIIDVINDHRVYLASVFLIILLVVTLDWLGGRLCTVNKQVEAVESFEGKANDAAH